MGLHDSTFEYLKPSDEQMELMAGVRQLYSEFVAELDSLLPDGPDKTVILRKLRDCAMWSNVTITRNADGSPRA